METLVRPVFCHVMIHSFILLSLLFFFSFFVIVIKLMMMIWVLQSQVWFRYSHRCCLISSIACVSVVTESENMLLLLSYFNRQFSPLTATLSYLLCVSVYMCVCGVCVFFLKRQLPTSFLNPWTVSYATQDILITRHCLVRLYAARVIPCVHCFILCLLNSQAVSCPFFNTHDGTKIRDTIQTA